MENKLFMYESNDNGSFTCLAYGDLAKYAVCGRVSILCVANSLNQTHSSMIYPAGTRDKVNPRMTGRGSSSWRQLPG